MVLSARLRCPAGLAVLLLLAGCGESGPPAQTRDAIGRAVTLPAHVGRVVALAPNLTEILFAIGAGPRVVATDDASDFPPAVRALPKVGAMQPNVEKIVTLGPDLVLASTEGNHPNLSPALAAARIPLYVVKTDRIAEIAPAMRQLGSILGSAEAADAAARRLEADIAAQRRVRPRRVRILFAVWADPLYVAGTSTFTSDLFTLCGAENAVAKSGWPQYPLELVARSSPDLLLYPEGAVSRAQVDAMLARLPGIRPLVVPVDEDLFQRPGPRVAEAARELNGILDRLAAANAER